MKNSKGVSLISLVITIIVMIILAAIVISNSSNTTQRAQYAKFSTEFGDYADTFQKDAVDLMIPLALDSTNVNEAQRYYMTANGIKTLKSGDGATADPDAYDRTLPAGYKLTDTLKKIFDISGDDVVAYVIDDKYVSGYAKNGNNDDGSAGKQFTGNSNGKEYHFVTSDGNVFTLPGFAETAADNTIKFYISNKSGQYYIAKGRSSVNVGSLNVDQQKVDVDKPITADQLKTAGLYGLKSDGTTTVDSYTTQRHTVIK